mmetsp:Transcript_115288/g.200716  ORF Transcript_115288/g.200716 Transcript_115288/m.200716 type:complete len:91 (-) Transcript_115288:845-1117(-)
MQQHATAWQQENLSVPLLSPVCAKDWESLLEVLKVWEGGPAPTLMLWMGVSHGGSLSKAVLSLQHGQGTMHTKPVAGLRIIVDGPQHSGA